MLSIKRAQGMTDRLLVSSLTRACETAKSEIIGFTWLTHEVDYHAFPSSLQIVWVFDTQANLAEALEIGQGKRMYELTAQALAEADVAVGKVEAHVRFDTEEACQKFSDGNWQSRLAQLRSASR
ncbi:MAG TPA: hypothetical protein ENI17_05065 [Pseudomonas xinjiangensis]|uniref:Fis family transcriptional regulator n=2 Tax=root TaxID=1 RepID=A0A7V1FTD1_9GAMM|nr:hypothetical protein [Halopseudomonas xinjiangensis]HEC46982.1 hypothetical protein [Halopseudomonas xinjiangensis]